MCVVPLKDRKGITIDNSLQKIVSKERKSAKILVDQGGEFYNKLFKRFLKVNNIEMYSTYNEEKSVVANILEIWKTKFLSTWQLFQKMFILMC